MYVLLFLWHPTESEGRYKLEAFNKYGIPSFVLNEDTPYDPVIWKVCSVYAYRFIEGQ